MSDSHLPRRKLRPVELRPEYDYRPTATAGSVGGLFYFVLRFMAIRYGWRLPAARVSGKTNG